MKLRIAKILHDWAVRLGYDVRVVKSAVNVNITQQTTIGTPMQLNGGCGTNFAREQQVKQWYRYTFSFFLLCGKNDKIEHKMEQLEREAQFETTFIPTEDK